MADSLTSITGISSGIDSKAVVDQIIAMERRPAVRMQSTIDANTRRSKALDDFKSKMDALKSAAATLADKTAFDAFSAGTSGLAANGRALLTATADAGAVPGAYQVKVLSLAKTQKLTASAGQTSATTALGITGTFDLRRPDDTVLGSVTLDGTETLEGVRDKINAFSSTAKVSASIVSATSDGRDQRLVLSAQGTGTANAFKLVATGQPGVDPLVGLGLSAPITQPAADAKVDIDGVTVTRSTNTLSDVLKGVTLNLSNEDANATATVTIDRLQNAPTDAVKGFVDAYNALQGEIKKDTASGGALLGESMVRTARGLLSSLVLAKGAGLPNDLATLGSVGVSLTKDGSLSFDATRFGATYGTRFNDLRNTLAERMTSVSDLTASYTKTVTGAVAQRQTSLTDLSARLTARIADVDARLEKKRTALLAQYAKFEASLGGINAMGKTLTAQLNGLNNSGNNS